jgi:hypothetical protein
MKHPVILTSPLVLGLLLSACATAGEQKPTASSPRVVSEERAGINPQGDAAAKVKISAVTATVESIDLATRMVTIVGPDGKSFVVHADEQVRNLAQIKAGDKVTVEYYEGLIAEIGPTGTAPDEVKGATVVGRAPLGESPAGAVAKAVTATVVIEHVDLIRNVVQFKGPLGKTRIVKVMEPEFRTMLKKLKPGDQVTLTYFEALAVSVKPASN